MMDEVIDTGAALIFKRRNQEVRVPYADIHRLIRSKKRHDYSITMYLKNETLFDSRLMF